MSPRGSLGTASVPVSASHPSHGSMSTVPQTPVAVASTRASGESAGRHRRRFTTEQHGVDRVRRERDDVQQHADIDAEAGCRHQRRRPRVASASPIQVRPDRRSWIIATAAARGEHGQEGGGESGRAGGREQQADVGERVVERDAGEPEQDRARLAERAQEPRSARGERNEHEEGDREPADREHRGRAGLERPARDDVRGRPEHDREADRSERQPAVRHAYECTAAGAVCRARAERRCRRGPRGRRGGRARTRRRSASPSRSRRRG